GRRSGETPWRWRSGRRRRGRNRRHQGASRESRRIGEDGGLAFEGGRPTELAAAGARLLLQGWQSRDANNHEIGSVREKRRSMWAKSYFPMHKISLAAIEHKTMWLLNNCRIGVHAGVHSS